MKRIDMSAFGCNDAVNITTICLQIGHNRAFDFSGDNENVQSVNTYPPVAICIGRALQETRFNAKKPPETELSAVQPLPDNKKPGTDRLEPLNREACAALKARFHDMNDFIRDFGPISLLLSAEGLAFLREYQALACSLMPGLEEYLDKLAFADNLAWRARLTQLKADFSDLKIQD